MGGGGPPGMGGGPGGPGGPGGGPGRGPRGMMGGGNNRGPSPFILPPQPVRPGDTWTDSMTTGGGDNADQPTMSVQGTFKLDRVDNRGGSRIAVITWSGTMTTSTPRGPQVMNVIGEIAIDLTGHRLSSMDMNMSGTMQSPQGSIPMRVHMTQAVQ